MNYGDYIGNLVKLAVESANGDEPSELRREMFRQHRIAEPDAERLATLLPGLRDAVQAAAQGGPIDPINALLEQHPPLIRVDDHDGEGTPHLHFAPNGEDAVTWLGRSCGAALAHVVCGDPAVTIGRCHAAACGRFYVDDSRNRTRRFCSNTCASRTTVAAYRSRRKAAGESA
ncbi:CGNR zinc finger domain-containing protein [Streptomyces sp. NPDC001663]|uniref:CGNR zinc finger domain-containing protein n=1 Tax=Streptomyces sp. NPDC001663 TaxID=3364597 RepID=UPI0036C07B19